jgi:hypothetical protein
MKPPQKRKILFAVSQTQKSISLQLAGIHIAVLSPSSFAPHDFSWFAKNLIHIENYHMLGRNLNPVPLPALILVTILS